MSPTAERAKARGGAARGRRIVITEHVASEPDLWPGDEVWDKSFTRLGTVDADGVFVPDDVRNWS